MESVIAFLQDCRLGKKQVHRNLTIFPVLYPGALKPCYLPLEQAMDSGAILATEVDASGNVNRLKLRNNARQPVLLVEGEELKGAKQNRIVNASLTMSDLFEHVEDQLTAYADSFYPVEQQAGVIFAVDGTVAGLECFGCCDTFGRFFDKLIHSYAMDAIESVETSAKTPLVQPGKAKAFVESIKKAKGQRHPVVSIGATISFESRIAAGTALADGKRIIHMSAFRKTGKSGKSPLEFHRFSHRRANQTRYQISRSHIDNRPEIIE